MQKKSTILYLLIILFSAFSLSAIADEPLVYVMPFEDFVVPDSVFIHEILHSPSETIITIDTIVPGIGTFYVEPRVSRNIGFLPDPERTFWLGAIIPGFGQIVNRKYWKLPFVYGGFMGCAFAITWFNREYNSFRIMHRDLLSNDPSQRSYQDFLDARGMSLVPTFGSNEDIARQQFGQRLVRFRDNNRRFRDLSVLATILFYGLVVLDAYVDAHLYDFDINPDLSMRIEPTIINNNNLHRNPTQNEFDFAQTHHSFSNQQAIGIQWSLRLR